MKTEFELNLDNNGLPCIRFKHHNNDKSLEQKILGIFIEAIKEKGLELKFINHYDGNDMWDTYEIQVK